MWQVLGSAVDFVHALLMVLWFLGMPLLFWHGQPALTRIYALFSLAFVFVSQVSRWALGECVFTTLARWLWGHQTGSARVPAAPDEWFTVRLSRAIFDMAPSHRAIAVASELLSVVVAVGILSRCIAFEVCRFVALPAQRLRQPAGLSRRPRRAGAQHRDHRIGRCLRTPQTTLVASPARVQTGSASSMP